MASEPLLQPLGTQARRDIALYEKCRSFTRAREAQATGLYPYFREISHSEDTEVTMEGKRRIMFGSNNYLGLAHHPKIFEAASRALETYGSGCTGSRLLNGTLDLHIRLESELAAFVGKEDCLVFPTGYSANLGLISGLATRGDVVYLDKLDHASIVDGAQLSKAESVRFRHGDLAGLEAQLERHGTGVGSLIICDGVYSMDGIVLDVPGLVEVARRHDAALAVDDAHALGVLGPGGEGTPAHFGLTDEVDIIVGTFSKSLASIGGFVAATESVVHYLRHHSRPFMFSAALPPSSTAGVLAALDIVKDEPDRRRQLWANTKRFKDGLEALGFDVGDSTTPIVPILVGSLDRMLVFWRKLFDECVYTNPVIPPAVPANSCRLRTGLMATHTFAQIDRALEAFEQVGREMDVL